MHSVDNGQLYFIRNPYGYNSRFSIIITVINSFQHWAIKNLFGSDKVNAMFDDISLVLDFIPLKTHFDL